MSPRSLLSRGARRARFLFVAALLAGCGSGTIGILDSSSSSSSTNADPRASDLVVTGTHAGIDADGVPRAAPARITFRLSDEEDDMARISLVFELPGDPTRHPMHVASENDPSGGFMTMPVRMKADGRERTFYWFFTEEAVLNPGGSQNHLTVPLMRDVKIIVDVRGGDNANTFVDVGNDAPKVLDARLQMENLDEYSGSIPFVFGLEDSSGDFCGIRIWYELQGGNPELVYPVGYEPGANEPPPEFAMENLESGLTPVEHVFVWDSVRNVPGREEPDVHLVFQAFDGLAGSTLRTTIGFNLDNNAAPEAILLNDAVVADSDQRRLIPVPVFVRDVEGDAATVFLQWRRDEQPFPDLPTGLAAVRAVLDDPLCRIEHQICTESPLEFRGLTAELEPLPPTLDPQLDHVRLPELASTAAGLLSRQLIGRTLEVLRPESRFETGGFAAVLQQPVAALPLGDGTSALVLDHSGANWRLQEVDLLTREATPVGGGVGLPRALALEADEAHAVVGTEAGSGWLIERVQLGGGVVATASGNGVLRGLALHPSLGVYASVDDSLLRVDVAGHSVSIVRRFAEPRGLALDPIHEAALYVGDSGAGRVFHVDLMTSRATALSAMVSTEPEPEDPDPRSIAVDATGTRLFLTDGAGRLFGLPLRAPDGTQTSTPVTPLLYEIETGTGALGSIATGDRGLRLATIPQSDELAVAAGVAFRREIEAYAPEHHIATLVPDGELPGVAPGLPWRILDRINPVFPPNTEHDPEAGVVETLLWDTSDAAGGGDLQLRVYAYDTDLGLSTEGVSPKRILVGPEGVSEEGDQRIVDDSEFSHPVTLAAADFDRDGDIDLASIPSEQFGLGFERFTIYPQIFPGEFEGQAVVLDCPECGDPIPEASDLIATDLDGDDLVDLVAASRDDRNLRLVEVALGPDCDPPHTDTLICGSALTLALGGVPVSVVAADLSSDGIMDLATVQVDPNQLSVFLQDPVFGPAPDLEVPIAALPSDLAAADWNGDGATDLAVATDAGLTILYRTQAGFLSDFVDLTPVSTVAAADLDGDGRIDLVTATSGVVSEVRAHLQDKTAPVPPPGLPATFEPPRSIGPVDRSIDLVVADLDGSGTLDVASANLGPDIDEESGNVTVFYQDLPLAPGTIGTFSPDIKGPLFSALERGVRPNAIEAIDLDGDGLLELVAATTHDFMGFQEGAGVAVYDNKAPGNFVSPILGRLGGVTLTPDPDDFTAADLDVDGDLDIVVASGQPGTPDQGLVVFQQTAPGAFVETSLPVTGLQGLLQDPLGVLAVDVDGDGNVDLVSYSNGPAAGTVQVFRSHGNHVYSHAVDLATDAPIEGLGFGDVAAHGKIDLVALAGDRLEYFLLEGGFVFERFTFELPIDDIGEPRAVAVADLGGAPENMPDGLLDVVVATDLGIVVYEGVPPLTSTGLISYPANGDREIVELSVADLDGDGRSDVVVGDNLQDNERIYVFRQTQDASMPATTTLEEQISPSTVVLFDFDADGDQDILSINVNDHSDPPTIAPPTLFIQVRPGEFERLSNTSFCETELSGQNETHAIAADIDGDGEVDLVAGYREPSVLQICFGGH